MHYQHQTRPPEIWQRFPEQQNQTGATLAGLLITAGGAAYTANKQSKAAKKAREAGQLAQVDPAEIARLAREQAGNNVRDSLALESQYAPQNAAFRNQALQALMQLVGNDSANADALRTARGELEVMPDSTLLDSVARVAGDDLALGGQLPVETRNEISRRSIAAAGRTGGGRLGLSRFTTPRDLGLGSLALREGRLNRASQVGQQQFGASVEKSNLRQRLAALLSNLGGAETSRATALAGFGQTLQPPQAGLDPGAFASLYVQNASNAATAGNNAAALQAANARNTGQLFGGIGGMVQGIDWSKIFGGSRTPQPAATAGYIGDMNNAYTG